ncbi:MAG: DegQ family serine endoprotease [Pseudomonadota bacterium]
MRLTHLSKTKDSGRRSLRHLVLGASVAMVATLGVATAPVSVQPALSQATVQGPQSVADLAEGLLGAVVNISTSQKVSGSSRNNNRRSPFPRVPDGSPFQEFFDEFFKGPNNRNRPQPRSRNVQSLGSGFVIDPTGIVITNNHVIADADEITVNFSDGRKLKATVVGKDKKTDIAVLKVEPKAPLQSVSFGDSKKARIGDWVMAIGNPFGLGGTVTLGIVSAINRDIRSGPYDNFIQTDASINRGNSGGPLFNMYGEVIGINTAIISPSGGSIGIGFSIPSDLAQNVIAQLREFGETKRGWLGVRIQQVTDEIADSLGMDQPKGALVAGITRGGPAEKSNIITGDVILKFDGRDIKEMRDLPRIVADSPVGKAVKVLVLRKGKEQTIDVVLGRLEEGEKLAAGETTGKPAEDPKKAYAVFGMTLDSLTDEFRKQFEISEDVKGVVVAEVDPNSSAAEKGVRKGDVIVEIGQEAVSSTDDVKKRIEELKKSGRKNALLLLASKTGELRFAVVRME